MFTLETGQALIADPSYKVFKGGEYAPNDLVEVYTDDPTTPMGQFPAIFIATGAFE